jgi:phosphate-selective porin
MVTSNSVQVQRELGLEGIFASGPLSLQGEYSAGRLSRRNRVLMKLKYDTASYYVEAVGLSRAKNMRDATRMVYSRASNLLMNLTLTRVTGALWSLLTELRLSMWIMNSFEV